MAKIFYNLFWWPARLVLKFFIHLRAETEQNLKELQGPLIVVSNHVCWADPFIIGVSFPFLARIFPIRYACLWKFFYLPPFFFFNWAFGGFPVWRGIGLERALRKPLKILKKGGVVGVFPEGQREWKGIQKPKRGAAFLAIKTKTKILPVKIEAPQKMKILDIFFRRYKIKVKIGKLFSLPPQKIERPEDLNQPSEFIMSKIREL